MGQSGHERVARAIVSRDKCLVHILGGRGGAAAEDAAYYFDVELLMLSSALDAVAQVAHYVHGVKEDARSVGWRRARWRQALKKAAKPLWAATEQGTPERDAIELVALLRNTIHGEGMRKVEVSGRGRVDNQLVISAGVAAELPDVLNRHGGESDWGFTLDAYPRLEPAVFSQRILPFVTDTMNNLMALTEVERLPGVGQAALQTGPPAAEDWFRSDLTERLLLLAGLAS